MKRRSLFFVAFLMLIASAVWAQGLGQYGNEPGEEELGAPLYPGAEFIRKTVSLDQFYETAMYVTLVPMELVENFYNRKLPDKRLVFFSDPDIYLTAYLLKTWSQFPGSPTRDELDGLGAEPTVQIRFFDPNPHEALAEYFDAIPDGKMKANMLRNGQTMILYTFEKKVVDQSSEKIVGIWQESSRGLPAYHKGKLAFNKDGTYSYTYLPENINLLASDPRIAERYPGKSADEIASLMTKRNPETGTYVIMRNTITMASEQPVDGMETKSGLADVKSSLLTLKIIDKPRLTFVKVPE